MLKAFHGHHRHGGLNANEERAIPVWNLPPEGKTFLYNNQEFTWKTCPCGCKRPSVYCVAGDNDEPMTFRMRGPNQNDPRLAILYKLGKIEETAEALADEEIFSSDCISKLLGDTIQEIEFQSCSDPEVFYPYLESRGVTRDELRAAWLNE
jgi:hypothetical protein